MFPTDHYHEPIHMKEARAMNWCVRRMTKSCNSHSSRRLLLCDNMSVVLAFERRRAHNFSLLKQVRLFSALAMASNIALSIRWIMSELNPSDPPSRRFEHTHDSPPFFYQIDDPDLHALFRDRFVSNIVFDKETEEWIGVVNYFPSRS